MARNDLKKGQEELNDAFIDGLATYVESVHTAHELTEEGAWSETPTSLGPATLRGWPSPSVPRLARIHADFWKGVFSLYREQSERTTDELRGRLQRRRSPEKRTFDVTLHLGEDDHWRSDAHAIRVRNPGAATITPEFPANVTFFDRNQDPWSSAFTASLDREALQIEITWTRNSPTEDVFPLVGEVKVGLTVEDDENAIEYQLRLTCDVAKR